MDGKLTSLKCVCRLFQELKYAHEELIKQKTSLQNRIQDREQEIERLRNQVFNMHKEMYHLISV